VLLFNLLLLGLLLVAWLAIQRLQRAAVATEQRHREELTRQQDRFEEAQRQEKARFESLFDTMIEGLVVIDEDRRLVLANRAAEDMFRFSRMMAGGTLLEAIRNHEVATLARRAVVEDAPIEHEVRIEYPQRRVLLVSAVALRDRGGKRAGAVLVFHDVTQLRQLESMRQDFVANVSHELRTPLSLIRSATETLLDGGKNDPAVTSRFLQIIDKHAGRLTLLIDDLLLLARLDSGRIELNLANVAVRDVVQDTLDDAGPAAQGRATQLVNAVPEALEARADAVRLRQVLGNLVDNALKYGRNGGTVTITARAISTAMMEVAVRDDGPGIPAEATERIFERFYRVDKARSREQGGTGLGLAIVKNVVQAHGGDVRVESAFGEGATFFFTLPLAREE
jgi:two-component system phosphate regulon sensor histidine kinase PhoR